MPQYILRDLPADLWTKVKDRAQREGWPLRALFLQLLAEYAIGRLTLGSPPRASPSLLSLHRAPSTGSLPVAEAPALHAITAARPTRPTATRVAVIRLHDGDREERITNVAEAEEQDEYLILYDAARRPLARLAQRDLKGWYLIDS